VKRRIHQIKIILLVALIVAVVGMPIFAYFKVKSGAHIALREGKNIKLTMQMLDIEYYGKNQCIYDASSRNGLRDGAEEQIQKMLEHDGEVVLHGYDRKERTIRAFTYRNDNYEVIYSYDEDAGDQWQIYYCLKVID
jgi:hypothetical protein